MTQDAAVADAVGRFGATAKAKLANVAAIGQPEDQLRGPLEALIPALAAQPPLPDLAQVTGWSRADPAKTPHDSSRALFGGFRVEHLTEEQVEAARGARAQAALKRRLLRGE